MPLDEIKQILEDKGLKPAEVASVYEEVQRDVQRDAEDFFPDVGSEQEALRVRFEQAVVSGMKDHEEIGLTQSKALDACRSHLREQVSQFYVEIRAGQPEEEDRRPTKPFEM